MKNIWAIRNTKFAFAEVEHTGIDKYESNRVELCPLFDFAYTYENEGKRIRRFVTNFSSN